MDITKCEYGVLNIPAIAPVEKEKRDSRTGRYKKGHVPANKGKKWSEYMSETAIENVRKGWKNLDLYRPKHRPDNAGRRARQVIGINPDGKLYVFPSIAIAGRATGIARENIRNTCAKKPTCKKYPNSIRKKAGGWRWFYESDNSWLDEINQ